MRGLRWGAIGVLEVDSGAFSNWAVLRPLVVMGVDDLRDSACLGGVKALSVLPGLCVALGWLASLDILGFLGATGEESVSVVLGCGRAGPLAWRERRAGCCGRTPPAVCLCWAERGA